MDDVLKDFVEDARVVDISELPTIITNNPPVKRTILPVAIGECEAGMIDLEDKAQASAALAKMPDAELALLADKVDVVVKFCTRLKEEIARRVDANGGNWGEWASKESSGGREINDVQAAFDAVSGDMDASEFLACCKVSVPTLEKQYAMKMKVYGCAKTEKEGVAMFRDTLTDLIVERPAKRTIIHK